MLSLGVNKNKKKLAFCTTTVSNGYCRKGMNMSELSMRDKAINEFNRNAELLNSPKFWVFVVIVATIIATINSVAFASPQAQLTDVFTSEAFRGSWAVVNEFSFMGWILNWIISAFSIIGLCLIMYSRFVTLLYLAARNVFDSVYELKSSSGESSGFFGFFDQAKTAWKSSEGADALISFLLCLLPNIKKYSDYNPERQAVYNIDENDNVWKYMLKVAPSTVALMFFFTIGFSGVLAQLFGNVVSAMATLADNAVTVNLSSYVNQLAHYGNGYDFQQGATNQQPGVLYSNVEQSVYDKLCIKYAITNGNYKQQLGTEIAKAIPEILTSSAVGSALNDKSFKGTTNQWSSVNYHVYVSPNNKGGQGSVGNPIDVHRFLPGLPAGKEFISIYVTSSGSTNPNVFQPAGSQ